MDHPHRHPRALLLALCLLAWLAPAPALANPGFETGAVLLFLALAVLQTATCGLIIVAPGSGMLCSLLGVVALVASISGFGAVLFWQLYPLQVLAALVILPAAWMTSRRVPSSSCRLTTLALLVTLTAAIAIPWAVTRSQHPFEYGLFAASVQALGEDGAADGGR